MKNARGETRVALDARAKVETELGALKEKHAKMAEQLKEAVRARDSAEVGLKTTDRQFEELRKARETAQLFKEAVEAEKQATYALGVQETQSRLTEEFSVVATDYCDISWGKALDAVRIPADFILRRPESIYYDLDICKLSSPSSSPSAQPAQVSEVPTADQAPPAPVETSIDPHPDAGKGKEAEAPQGKDKGKGRASDTTISQPEQAADPGAPKSQV